MHTAWQVLVFAPRRQSTEFGVAEVHDLTTEALQLFWTAAANVVRRRSLRTESGVAFQLPPHSKSFSSKFNQTRFAQAKEVGAGIMLPVTDDDVVENSDTHYFARANQLFGDFDILG
jgi:hypothetical protein